MTNGALKMATDKEIEAALRAWWELLPTDPLPWDENPKDLHFRDSSLRDMRTALIAAEQVRASELFKIAEAIARDTSCAQGEFHERGEAILSYLTSTHD